MAKQLKPSQRAADISEKLASSMGYEHLETAFEKENVGVYLRIYLDKPGGITLDDCEMFHKALMPLVQEIDYDYLEVCSAGIDRPIKTIKDAQKSFGKEVEVRLYKPEFGSKEHRGILESYDKETMTIETEDGQKKFSINSIALARPVVDLSILEETNPSIQEETE